MLPTGERPYRNRGCRPRHPVKSDLAEGKVSVIHTPHLLYYFRYTGEVKWRAKLTRLEAQGREDVLPTGERPSTMDAGLATLLKVTLPRGK